GCRAARTRSQNRRQGDDRRCLYRHRRCLQCLPQGISQGGMMRAFRLSRLCRALVLLALTPAVPAAGEEDTVDGGEALVRAGGGTSCHTTPGGQNFAGGRALKTPFGTFYSPNITPDADTGIGGWTDTQFLRALREGIRPDGANYFPVFPYTSFTGITNRDAL